MSTSRRRRSDLLRQAAALTAAAQAAEVQAARARAEDGAGFGGSPLAGPIYTARAKKDDKPVTAQPPAVSVSLGDGCSYRLPAIGAP